MNLELVEATNSVSWDSMVERLGGSVHHTNEWIEFTRLISGVEPIRFRAKTASNEAAVVAYLSRSKRWPLSLWPFASTDAYPLGADPLAVLSALEAALRTRGVAELTVGSLGAPAFAKLGTYGYLENHRLEFVIDLAGGLERVWQGFRSTQRNEIRRFEGSSVVCREAANDKSLDDFAAIEDATFLRHRSQGKSYSSVSRRTLGLLWCQVLKRGRGRAYFALHCGVAVAAALVGFCGPRVYLLYTGSTQDGLKVHAAKGLIWHLLQEEYRHGAEEFNFGGMPASAASPDSVDHGLYRFKLGFGATQRLCIGGMKVLRPVASLSRGLVSRLGNSLRAEN